MDINSIIIKIIFLRLDAGVLKLLSVKTLLI